MVRYIPQEQRVVWSASDLKASAECEFAWVHALDARLGRTSAVVEEDDPMLERAARMGTLHEERVLDDYRARFPGGVVEIPAVRASDAEALGRAVSQTNEALRNPAVAIIYQAAFSTEDFVGFADFLVRDVEGAWIVQDTKLARRARVTALMQLCAYVAQLDRLEVPRSDRVELLLGDGTVSTHSAATLLPVFALRVARLQQLIRGRQIERGAELTPLAWGDASVFACGRCASCEEQLHAHDDVLLVAGMRPAQRERLRAAGILTKADLAEMSLAPEGMPADAFSALRLQAELQEKSEGRDAPLFEIVEPRVLGTMPRPDLGDIFFDFEGDPLHEERGLWGIDYLFGWVDRDEKYTALWAHSVDDEKKALIAFMDYVAARRAAHSAMHIYHYAPYEVTHLLAMAARHGVREAELDRLLREGVFVDLYPIVRQALRVGSRSYSIKKLEPLYMGGDIRESDVKRGDDSIVRYVEARALFDEARDTEAQLILDDLAEYNRDDCVSTLRLRDWLIDRAREAGVVPARDLPTVEGEYAPSPRAARLEVRASTRSGSEREALDLAAAAIDYYPREEKSFWSAHFERLREPIALWADTRDVVQINVEASSVYRSWRYAGERARSESRLLDLRGEVAPGSTLRPGGEVYLIYRAPAPFPVDAQPRWLYVAHLATVVEEFPGGVRVEERAVQGHTWAELPLAVTPGPGPRAGAQQRAIEAWADTVLDRDEGFPEDPASDLLLRRKPRLRGEATLPKSASNTDVIEAIVQSVQRLDRSALAVQGPPGTGKTYVGSHSIARLVQEHGWRVGVVAQSHAVVEHMLERIARAGVPVRQIAKAPKDPMALSADAGFTPIRKNQMASFLAESGGGVVVGGTAWDFANEARVSRGSLDLLVVDEAGQFSLASTIAVSLAARRLLLLGDPQQLPQVSQGVHPAPVDTSALGWLLDGAAVIDEEHGFFLAESRRMHPSLADSVSRLSYDGKLRSYPAAALRSIDGIAPGVHSVPVAHRGRTSHSPEEAEAVVRIVRDMVGRTFTDLDSDGDATATPREITAQDVIVVTPYNAQQEVVSAALAEAGFPETPVGTVDRFQGREAAVAIVALAASTARDAPRGLEFLLLANRLNVAISRAQCAAYIVASPGLLDDLPLTPEGVVRLGAYATLLQDAR